MEAAAVPGALAACRIVASRCGLQVDDLVVLNDSNRLAVHLRPCGVLARVAPDGRREGAAFEVEMARLLAGTGAPVAMLDPRVQARVHDEDGFAVTLWTYHEPVASTHELGPSEYAGALERLHAGLRLVDVARSGVAVPHFIDRVAEAQGLVDDPTNNADLTAADRELLARALASMSEVILGRGGPEQLLHGEPHPGNLLRTREGLLFVDLETCCRGPVEFDIAHAAIGAAGPPMEVAAHYAGADPSLVRACWTLMLAMIVAWRCEPGDDLPDGRVLTQGWLRQLRAAMRP